MQILHTFCVFDKYKYRKDVELPHQKDDGDYKWNDFVLLKIYIYQYYWFVFTKGYHTKQTAWRQYLWSPLSDPPCLFNSTPLGLLFFLLLFLELMTWLLISPVWGPSFLMALYRHHSFLYSITFNHSQHHVMWKRTVGLIWEASIWDQWWVHMSSHHHARLSLQCIATAHLIFDWCFS